VASAEVKTLSALNQREAMDSVEWPLKPSVELSRASPPTVGRTTHHWA
jgi:hypothetical protein